MGFYFPETIVDTEDVANEINLSEKFYRNIGVKKYLNLPKRSPIENGIRIGRKCFK